MPNGYHGKILHVHLDTGRIEVETPPESFYRTYMGGGAMATYYILREVPKGADPLGPENLLAVFPSVVTGAAIAGLSRINVNAKSPMSGAIGDSQGGGFFPAEFKFAGFDGVLFHGRSPKWVYLAIIDGKAELHDAAHLTGKVTGEVDALLKQEAGDGKVQVMQVGPAAEKGVRFAGIVNMANRLNGRTGMGLVMASKKLKAIVVRGHAKVQLADAKAVAALNKAGAGWIPTNPDVEGLGRLGTASVVMPQNSFGTLPTRNYTEGQFEGAEPISGEKMAETILKGRDTCYACTVRCKRVVEISEGKYKVDPVYGGAEYETIGTFGSYCGIADLAAVSLAHQVCDMHGVDTISCGATIAFAMECFEKGIITKEDTGGIELRFGNAEAMLETLNQIVTKSGKLGTALAEGSARAAKHWGRGAEDCLITVKGEEAPAHMPQAKRSLALIYAVNPFGADHQSSEHDWMIEEGMASDLYMGRLAAMGLTEKLPPMSLGDEKIKFAYLGQAFYSMMDTLELCQFVWGPAWCLFGPLETVEMVRAVTGWEVTLDELLAVGIRRINLMRTFNAREGLTRKDDALPQKFFTPLGGTGPTAGLAVGRDEFEHSLDEYYRLHDWTRDGIPTAAALSKYGIPWAVEHLPA
ncbi:MAG: aldehyde ferredoxin oxidoreductase family protein [Chloroflexi bacterium]|nr:aldehyde ferredoxin oxidoreductase family protein [Chloroflexota bacterium]